MKSGFFILIKAIYAFHSLLFSSLVLMLKIKRISYINLIVWLSLLQACHFIYVLMIQRKKNRALLPSLPIRNLFLNNVSTFISFAKQFLILMKFDNFASYINLAKTSSVSFTKFFVAHCSRQSSQIKCDFDTLSKIRIIKIHFSAVKIKLIHSNP